MSDKYRDDDSGIIGEEDGNKAEYPETAGFDRISIELYNKSS